MLELLQRLFNHMRWADERALDALRRANDPAPTALGIYAHVLGAEHVWLARLRREMPTVAVWPTLSLEECATLMHQNSDAYQAFFGSVASEDLRDSVAYKNSAGQAFESTVEDILLHVALHGSYHRGQVALLLRQDGAEPNPTDYIAFVRGAPAARRA